MRLLRATAPLFCLGVALAACSSGGAATTAPAASTTPAASEAPAASTSATGGGRYGYGDESAAPAASEPAASDAAGSVTVELASTTLGDVLADGSGRTLYVFTPDGTGAPTCYDTCAANWPALTSDTAPQLGAGLAAADFGTTARTDGTTQVTFHGMPLYYFAGDTAAGQTNGQGLNGKWYVVDATGTLVK